MPNSLSNAQKLIKLAKDTPILRAKDLREAGINSSTITAAIKAGTLERLSHGTYRNTKAEWDENLALSEVIARVPKAVIVLISALNFHGIGTHQAHAVYILLRQNAVKPRITSPQIEIIKSAIPASFTEGVETHRLNGIKVSITNPARTVADCFKHRSKLGLELCLEALKEIHRKGTTPAEILHYARMNRVGKIITPYLEALA